MKLYEVTFLSNDGTVIHRENLEALDVLDAKFVAKDWAEKYNIKYDKLKLTTISSQYKRPNKHNSVKGEGAGVGRPRKDPSESYKRRSLYIFLRDNNYEKLIGLCNFLGRNKSSILREFIDRGIEHYEEKYKIKFETYKIKNTADDSADK